MSHLLNISHKKGLIVFGGFTLGTGITFADFHVYGSIPSRNEALQIAVKGPARILA